MTKPLPPGRRRTGLAPIRLGWRQFAATAAGLGVLLVVVGIAFFPDWYDEYIKRAGIRQFETIYGFQTGSVSMEPPAGGPTTSWGIVSVVSGREFSRLGVRPGDIPWGPDGHAPALLYEALMASRNGKRASFDVLNAYDWRTTGLRKITVLPRKD